MFDEEQLGALAPDLASKYIDAPGYGQEGPQRYPTPSGPAVQMQQVGLPYLPLNQSYQSPSIRVIGAPSQPSSIGPVLSAPESVSSIDAELRRLEALKARATAQQQKEIIKKITELYKKKNALLKLIEAQRLLAIREKKSSFEEEETPKIIEQDALKKRAEVQRKLDLIDANVRSALAANNQEAANRVIESNQGFLMRKAAVDSARAAGQENMAREIEEDIYDEEFNFLKAPVNALAPLINSVKSVFASIIGAQAATQLVDEEQRFTRQYGDVLPPPEDVLRKVEPSRSLEPFVFRPAVVLPDEIVELADRQRMDMEALEKIQVRQEAAKEEYPPYEPEANPVVPAKKGFFANIGAQLKDAFAPAMVSLIAPDIIENTVEKIKMKDIKPVPADPQQVWTPRVKYIDQFDPSNEVTSEQKKVLKNNIKKVNDKILSLIKIPSFEGFLKQELGGDVGLKEAAGFSLFKFADMPPEIKTTLKDLPDQTIAEVKKRYLMPMVEHIKNVNSGSPYFENQGTQGFQRTYNEMLDFIGQVAVKQTPILSRAVMSPEQKAMIKEASVVSPASIPLGPEAQRNRTPFNRPPRTLRERDFSDPSSAGVDW